MVGLTVVMDMVVVKLIVVVAADMVVVKWVVANLMVADMVVVKLVVGVVGFVMSIEEKEKENSAN